MRRYFIITFILASVSAIFGGCCFGAQAGAEGMLSINNHFANFIMYPWTTFAFLSIGMSLIVIYTVESRIRNLAGTAGALLTGITLTVYITAGTGSLTALMIFLAGIILILIEARVLPGHGISAIAGIICEFTGVYLILGGAENGFFFPAAMALLVSMLSAAAFLAYISGSSKWKSMLHNIEIEKSQSCSTINIDTTTIKTHNIQGTGNRRDCGTTRIPTRVGKISVQTQPDTTLQDDTNRQLNSLRMMQAEIETCALPVLTDQHNAEQNLKKAKNSLFRLQNYAQSAAALGNDDLAKEILMQADICKSKVDEISQKLNKIKTYADVARKHIGEFEDELRRTEMLSINNDARMQIEIMRTSLHQTLDEGISVIENIESRADQICAEADALDSINSIKEKNQRQIDEYTARKQRAEQTLAEMKVKLDRQTSNSSSTNNQQPNQSPSQRIINKE